MDTRKPICILLALVLAAALLCGCGGEPTVSPDPTPDAGAPRPGAVAEIDNSVPEGAVVVTTVSELLSAIAPDATIYIDTARLDLDSAGDYGFGYSDGFYTWQRSYSGRDCTLVIRGVSGLTICGRGEGETRVFTSALSSDVLRFENCDGLTLRGLTIGHSGGAGGGCIGDVLSFQSCGDASIVGCELFGCGVVGVNACDCERLRMDRCTVRDCSMSAINATLCTDLQARDCSFERCGANGVLGAFCVAGCNGFALINCSVTGCGVSFLVDAMNSRSVCLMGCEVSSNAFSSALFRLYDYDATVSGCSFSDNEFGSCYLDGPKVARTGSGSELKTFGDFSRMELKRYEGEYYGPLPAEPFVPQSFEYEPYAPDLSALNAVHVKTVDELLAAAAPNTVIYLDAEEFDLRSASDYGTGSGEYYYWADAYDGPELRFCGLTDFAIVGGGMGVTLVSAAPRYANVLCFEGCSRISLHSMTLGHSEGQGYCTGNVVALYSCDCTYIEECGMFGCGCIGIYAQNGSDLSMVGCNIYDCSYAGGELYNWSGARFVNCAISNCGFEFYGGCNGLLLHDCIGVVYDGEELPSGEDYRFEVAFG